MTVLRTKAFSSADADTTGTDDGRLKGRMVVSDRTFDRRLMHCVLQGDKSVAAGRYRPL
jgi:hypothetical protein